MASLLLGNGRRQLATVNPRTLIVSPSAARSEPASRSVTSIPALARKRAAVAPGGPLPMTTTRLSSCTTLATLRDRCHCAYDVRHGPSAIVALVADRHPAVRF